MPSSSETGDTRSHAIRSTESFFSSSLNNHLPLPLFDSGKSGRMNMDNPAAKNEADPSIMYSHFQPAKPLTLSRPENTPAATSPENAVARMRAEYNAAMRRASSLRVYHAERM